MKKFMCCLMLLVMLVGCQRGPMDYEQGETYKINEQLGKKQYIIPYLI